MGTLGLSVQSLHACYILEMALCFPLIKAPAFELQLVSGLLVWMPTAT